MRWPWLQAVFAFTTCAALAQTPQPATRPRFDAFEVATIKLTAADQQGRYIKMDGANRFIERAYTLKFLLAAAYDLNTRTISGVPSWADAERFDIDAVTPGTVRPTHDEQMAMLRTLLNERFQLKFHREEKEFSIYVLRVAKSGPKLKAAASGPDTPPTVGPGVVYPQRVVLPGRNATVADLASLLQRAILDRPVLDKTELSGRYDFDLEWAPDETQFGGGVPAAPATAPALPLFEAIQQQLGLRLEATRGPVQALVVDQAERPSAN